MSNQNFWDENADISFPFVYSLYGEDFDDPDPPQELDIRRLPKAAIVDFGCVAGPSCFFDGTIHKIYLYEVRREDGQFVFQFRSTAEGMAELRLEFRRNVTVEDWELEYSDAIDLSNSLSDSESESACIDEVMWYGYLVTGNLRELSEILDSDGKALIADELAIVEPALISNLASSYVHSIAVCNADRTRADARENCAELNWPFELQDLYIVAECVQGDVRLVAGYNTYLEQSGVDNSITIGAGVGQGEGEPCVEVATFPGEQPPENRTTLDGGFTCGEVVRSVAGASGPVLTVEAGQGVTVSSDPSSHSITIRFDFRDMAVYYEMPEEQSFSFPAGGEC